MPHIIENLVAALIREWTVRRALKHLQGLEGRALRDMGLHRGNLDYAVRHGREAYGGAHIPTRSPSQEMAAARPVLEGQR